MPLHKFLHNLPNVLVQVANKMGLRESMSELSQMVYVVLSLYILILFGVVYGDWV
jgi:hypothetical protein